MMMVLLLLVSSMWMAIAPAGGLAVDSIDDGDLPIEWTLGGDESALFNVTLPPEGRVLSAELLLEGSGVDAEDLVSNDVDAWRDLAPGSVEGFDLTDDGLEVSRQHMAMVQGPDELSDYESLEGLRHDGGLRLDFTSPDFSASGGGTWTYYTGVDISLNSDQWEYGTMTYISVHIPEGHCTGTIEVRVADPYLQEVPYQVGGVVRSADLNWLVYVELFLLTDMAPNGPRTYRVYYGNPDATDPGYKPYLLGAEMWDYDSTLDPDFMDSWRPLPWSGVGGAGRASAFLVNYPGEGKMFYQHDQISPGRAFSQVWTGTDQKFSDFQMVTWIDSLTREGPWRSTFMWGMDFRVTGNDCYRLLYREAFNNNTEPTLGLYRVSTDRHLSTVAVPGNSWHMLVEKAIEPLPVGASVPILIQAVGNDITVYVDKMDVPILNVRDNMIDNGLLGTFLGGIGVLFSGEDTTISCTFGPTFIWAPIVNFSSESHTILPGPERRQLLPSGTYVSNSMEMDGARDTIFSIDVRLPPGTSYTATLLAPDDRVLIASIRDAQSIPEGLLDNGFKLRVLLESEMDHVTPELLGWGLGYRYAVSPLSERTPEDDVGVVFRDDGITLAPSRDLWFKEAAALLEPGNIAEDQAGVRVGSLLPYGNGYRLYYTGTASNNAKSICMAYTEDGRTFIDHRVLLRGSYSTLSWDAHKMGPCVVRSNDVWLMYFIGFYSVGAVGLAISSDGINWMVINRPILEGTPGEFDAHSIEDVNVIRDDSSTIFHMYYTGKASSTSGKTSIGHATSYDGGNFVKSAQNPVLVPSSTSSDWDSGYVRQPFPVLTRDHLIIYYLGGRGSNATNDPSAVGYATTQNGDDFRRSAANPVMEPKQGGLADDFRGIRSLMVFEDDAGRHAMLFTGQGIDWQERLFWADSGYMKEGHYTTKPFTLDQAPRGLGPLTADFAEPGVTTVTFWARSAEATNQWGEWVEMVPDDPTHAVAPDKLIQFRFNLSSEFGDETPRVLGAFMDYESNVRHSSLTYYPAHMAPDAITNVIQNLNGWGLDDIVLEVTGDGDQWTAADTWSLFTWDGEVGSFGYRLSADPSPGSDLHLDSVEFVLGYVSLPSDIAVDVGNDGTVDHRYTVGAFEGLHTLSVGEPTQTWYEDHQGGDEAITLTYAVSTATLGTLTLTGIEIILDTPPIVEIDIPTDEPVEIDEGDGVWFRPTVTDLDGDELTYEWWIEYASVSHDEEFQYVSEVDEDTLDPDPVTVKFRVSDGNYSEYFEWEVHVKDTTIVPNVGPAIDTFDPDTGKVTIKENQTVTFAISAIDPDLGPQALVYRWYMDDILEIGEEGTSLTIVTDFEWAGEYSIRVEAFDGEFGANHSWEFEVQNVKPPDGDNGNGGGTTSDAGIEWLPILLILVIIIVIGAAGAMYMRSKRLPTPGPEAEPVPEPVTADVPVEEEVAPSFTETVTKDVASGAGEGAEGSDLAGAAAATTPITLLPLADMDKDRTYVVEEVYVVYNDGRLMCHRARAERTSVDTDLFGGMFTAIQQFIQDSMGGAETGTQVGRLDYGENRILVERGNHIFLAAIIFGEEQPSLRDALRDVVNRIEGSYAGIIENWSGDQTQVVGIADFVIPLIGLTEDLNRETIMSRTRTEGVKMLSEVEFFQGFVRLKVAVRNDTKTVITNAATDIVYDSNVLRIDRIQPAYPMVGTKVTIGTIGPREKKTVAYYLDPLICQESDVDGTTSYKDAEGAFHTVTMKRRRADIVCPIFFTEENANTAMLKRLINEELGESDSKLFTIPNKLPPADAFALGKVVIRGHDVRFVREFVEADEGLPYRAEAWFYGVTKVKKDKMVIRTSVWEDRNTIEFSVASGRIEAITGLLAELGQNLNETLTEKYLGRLSATLVVDPEQQDEVRGLGLLIDKYSEGEIGAGEVDQ
jgi:hypothetical protein